MSIAATLLSLPAAALLIAALTATWIWGGQFAQGLVLPLLLASLFLATGGLAGVGFVASVLEASRGGPERALPVLCAKINGALLAGLLLFFLLGLLRGAPAPTASTTFIKDCPSCCV